MQRVWTSSMFPDRQGERDAAGGDGAAAPCKVVPAESPAPSCHRLAKLCPTAEVVEQDVAKANDSQSQEEEGPAATLK